MTVPYQCLASCTRPAGDDFEWLLFGATGSQLVVQSSTGATSTWAPETPTPDVKEPARKDDDEGPPGKRVKLTPVAEPRPNFLHLRTAKDGKYLVAVTAEDKCIRVFQADAQCHLEQLSQRCMPKRPSSVALTPDGTTILVADKFGDVYSLPLLPSPVSEVAATPEPKEEQKKFAPSASVLTVHSGRNRKALEEQLKQAEKGPKQGKEAPKFKHDLILGHVSMLTDVACTTVGSRSYILTADRDEHIRLSRGIPQAHVIEGFCQGHEEFVSRLCFTNAGHLVSGGGDPDLYLWDWLNYRLLEKISLQQPILERYKGHPYQNAPTEFKVAVSGLWSVPTAEEEDDEILVACEGLPALVNYRFGSSSKSAKVIPLTGNVLDLAFIDVPEVGPTAVISIDHVHEPGSTSVVRTEPLASRLQYLSRQSGEWREDKTLSKALEGFSRAVQGDAGIDAECSSSKGDDKALRDMLYGVENLRKRPGAEE
ncbi:guanine-N(7)--methyltransferase subunit TRM82 [Bimuria novae-zelandiae CBS 107.79]|uniref:Guanine-N(7)--methyltransferase subunit TRM82 n=1 Tax=Bimuria novae-zelandiae CBS 107.79 TaxID=1447943 RepID=A0A6A5UW62_9PLEO|nr:guanine-N(7)--methyltransferase subunit TRM82 [Bimuria novae-zelandiae CBS 107.79]